MLDQYKQKLEASPLDLGKAFVDPKTYTWKSEKIQNSVKRYYSKFFSISSLKIQDVNMDSLLSSYIEGLMWVMNYYYNLHIHQNNADVWFFPYNHAPLLTQLFYFMRNKGADTNYLLNIQLSLERYKVDNINFFNSVENLLYVTPVKLFFNKIESKYRKFIKEHEQYFIDIEPIIDSIIFGDETAISCQGVIFLNKCELKLLSIIFQIKINFYFVIF